MPHVLLITVRLHDGRYHGTRPDGTGDWPPSPARLFQALVAGAGLAGPTVLEEYSAALRWLEAVDPPNIAVPRQAVGQEFKNYVPQNDLDAYGGDHRRIGIIRTAKVIRPLLVNGDLLYAWRFNDDTEGMRHADAVCALAARLYQFGRGEDMAWAWGEVLSEDELEDRLSSYPGIVYRPSRGSRGSTLACPTRGSLESLEERYRASGRRFITDGKGKAARQTFFQPPKPRFVQVAYDSPPERLVFTLRDGADDGSFRPWPLAGALTLTQAVRDGVAIQLRRAFPDRAAEIERVFIGRKSNGDDDGPVSGRVRIIPLPSIGHAYADRGIRRILVEVPAECPFRAEDVHWALSGLPLDNPETGEVNSMLTLSRNDPMLRHCGVDAESRRWRTVTPAALPGWVWRGINEMRMVEDTRNAAHVVLLERVAEAVTKTLRFLNVRARVESVRVQREPFDARGEPTEAFVVGQRFDKGRLWHVEIIFETPVVGPLVIGDGRFLGLGIMAPVEEPLSLSAGAAGLAFVTPHAVQQFQDRIERLPYNQALAAILHSLNTAGMPRNTGNGIALYVRTRTPYRFRAILRPPALHQALPAVVTILKG